MTSRIFTTSLLPLDLPAQRAECMRPTTRAALSELPAIDLVADAADTFRPVAISFRYDRTDTNILEPSILHDCWVMDQGRPLALAYSDLSGEMRRNAAGVIAEMINDSKLYLRINTEHKSRPFTGYRINAIAIRNCLFLVDEAYDDLRAQDGSRTHVAHVIGTWMRPILNESDSNHACLAGIAEASRFATALLHSQAERNGRPSPFTSYRINLMPHTD